MIYLTCKPQGSVTLTLRYKETGFHFWHVSKEKVAIRGSGMGVITKTCLYNFDPLQLDFYTVKLGFTEVYIIFLISAQKHKLCVLVRTASARRF